MSILTRGLMLILLLAAVPTWAAPKLVVEHPEHDFGVVYQGERVPHAFKFSNQGEHPLVVNKVRSSCGCTAALASSREIAPGESGEIQANFDSTRFRGAVSKTVYLYTNDSSQPVVQLFLKGAVKEMVSIKPKQLNLGTVASGSSTSQEFSLVNQSDKPLVLKAPTTTAHELEASLADLMLEAGQQAVVQVRFTPKPGQVRFSGYVLISVEEAPQRELRIPVYAMIK